MSTAAFPPAFVLFVFGVCVLAGIVRLLTRWMVVHHTVVMFLIGALFGYIAHHNASIRFYVNVDFLSSAKLLQVHTLLLPIIILEYLFSMDPRVFLSCSPIAVVAAILDYVLTLLAQGTFVLFFIDLSEVESSPKTKTALIFLLVGSLTSVTDTSYVVNTFYKMGSYWVLVKFMEIKRVISLVGACVVYILVVYAHEMQYDIGWYEIFKFVLLQIFACPALGWLAAEIVIFWVGRLYNDLGVEITVSIAMAYLLYYFGTVKIVDKPMVSAITVVVYALLLNNRRNCFSLGLDILLHKLIRILAYVVKTVIFTISGYMITCEDHILHLGEENPNMLMFSNVLVCFTLYSWCTLARSIVSVLVSPILRRCGYKLSWQETATMVFCNVTGTVCLITAVASCNSDLTPLFYDRIDTQYLVMFHMGGLAIIRSLVAGTAFRHVLMILGMRHVSLGRYVAMNYAIKKVQEQMKASARSYKFDRFLADADWETVYNFTNFDDPYKLISRYTVIGRAMDLDSELLGDTRLHLLHAQKISFWRQYEQGLLSLRALRILLEECYLAESEVTTTSYDIGDQIKKHYEVQAKGMFRVINILKQKFEQMQEIRRLIIEEIRDNVTGKFNKIVFKIGLHVSTEIILIIAVIISTVLTIEALVHLTDCSDLWHPHYMGESYTDINMGFMIIFSAYLVLKFYIFKWRYLALFGSFINVMLFVIGWIEVSLHLHGVVNMNFTDVCIELRRTNWELTLHIFLHEMFLVLRCCRLFILLEDKTYIIVHTMKKRMLLQLQLGYDVGKAYVYCKEDVNQIAGEFVARESKLDLIQKELQSSRVQLMRDLATVQKKYPGIVVSVKSQEASRRLLNVAKETINQLQRNGRIDSFEADMMDEMIKLRLKRLNTIPAQIEIPSLEVLIGKLPWVNGDETLMRFLQFNSKLFNMAEGESVDFDSDPTAGLYILVSGLIRVNWTIGEPYGELQQSTHTSSDTSMHTLFDRMKLHDYLTTGSTFGELALLTENPIAIDAVCETTVLMFHVQYESISTALAWIEDPPLEWRLWQLAAVRLSLPLLKALPSYYNTSLEDLKLLTDHGTLTVKRLESQFQDGPNEETFNLARHSSNHVILIHGIAKHTSETFVGPIIIPPDNDDLVFSSVYCDVYVLYIVPHKTIPTASVGFAYSTTGSDISVLETSKDASALMSTPRVLNRRRGRKVSIVSGSTLKRSRNIMTTSSPIQFPGETGTIAETESASDSKTEEGLTLISEDITESHTPFSPRFSKAGSSILYETNRSPPVMPVEKVETAKVIEVKESDKPAIDKLSEVEPDVPRRISSSEHVPKIPYSEAWKYVNPQIKLTMSTKPDKEPTSGAPSWTSKKKVVEDNAGAASDSTTNPPTDVNKNNQNANSSSMSNNNAQSMHSQVSETPNQSDMPDQVIFQSDESSNDVAAPEGMYYVSMVADWVSFQKSEQTTTMYGYSNDMNDDASTMGDKERNQLGDVSASPSLLAAGECFDDADAENMNWIDTIVYEALTPLTSKVDLHRGSPTTKSSWPAANDLSEYSETVLKAQTVCYGRNRSLNTLDGKVVREPEPGDMALAANEVTEEVPGKYTVHSGLDTGQFGAASVANLGRVATEPTEMTMESTAESPDGKESSNPSSGTIAIAQLDMNS